MNYCKSCGAKILWVKMATGKMMPVDAQPVSFRTVHPGEKAALTLVTPQGRIARGIHDPGADTIGYTSHFATCPAAAEFGH